MGIGDPITKKEEGQTERAARLALPFVLSLYRRAARLALPFALSLNERHSAHLRSPGAPVLDEAQAIQTVQSTDGLIGPPLVAHCMCTSELSNPLVLALSLNSALCYQRGISTYRYQNLHSKIEKKRRPKSWPGMEESFVDVLSM